MATNLGLQILARYYAGTATVAHLDQALLQEWITQDEYDRAIAGLPPETQPPMPFKIAGGGGGAAYSNDEGAGE